MYIQKICDIPLFAYPLDEHHPKIRQLLEEKKLIQLPDGSFEVFSQETKGQAHGQHASAGDYIKIDGAGYPYPNTRDFFLAHHIPAAREDTFFQKPETRQAWQVGEPSNDLIEYLVKHGKLEIHPEDEDHYFQAQLWGTLETAAKDALVVIYEAERSEKQEILSVTFNLLTREEFEKTYREVKND
ncbi:hypothetical protein [uncultured Allobaculum sp.]|uniref:hypothetical protein n=2 Tax=uncultured Allobaculum sp. TaxID=1187017 RepID=UPI0025860F99|nr:hypothetical protein [uncultured Allobaculum sp.]